MKGWYDVRKKRMFTNQIWMNLEKEFSNSEKNKVYFLIDKLSFEDIKSIIDKLINLKCIQKKV